MAKSNEDIRVTVRFNESEKLKLEMLKKYLHEDDISKVIKFACDTALHHLDYVTSMAVSPQWNVIFTHKRKTQQQDRKIY